MCQAILSHIISIKVINILYLMHRSYPLLCDSPRPLRSLRLTLLHSTQRRRVPQRYAENTILSTLAFYTLDPSASAFH